MMKTICLLLALFSITSCMTAQKELQPRTFYEHTVTDIEGKEMSLEQFRGKYVLVVNVASKCGFTKQYEPLQELYERYQDKLVVIGFPSNQFLGQEPGTEEEIAAFCEKNYGVTFPLTSKIDVKGSDQHPIYEWLTTKELNGVENAKVSWNFNKFLISPNGEWVAHFGSKTEPLDEEITSKIR